ncbi:Isochorismatase-like protein [Tricharina praecox]|uniref:Isochorismatase-like protein n=1 Tax=Tricharina praecox TaxID=43433 RepID=UPI002220DECD|nr:Isochorismatase-like protein [Tricharina praecox]KAI5856536.1 Isochorismatase-like protein [Tricharina praecox]
MPAPHPHLRSSEVFLRLKISTPPTRHRPCTQPRSRPASRSRAMPDPKLHIPAHPYAWPHDGDLASSTALVIIDMQNEVCTSTGYLAHQGYPIFPMRAPIPHIARLLSLWRSKGWPVYHTREGHRADLSDCTPRELFRSRRNPSGLGIGDAGPMGRLLIRGEAGHDIIPELYPWFGEPVIDKPGRSAFANTDFELLLRIRGVTKLVIVGVTTDVCVHTTMRDADDRGIECLLVREACAAAVEELGQAALDMVACEGGIFGAVAGIEDVMSVLREGGDEVAEVGGL